MELTTTTTHDLMQIAKQYDIKLFVYAKDQLPKQMKQFTIINMDDSDGGGTHWVAVYKDSEICYFDPFGVHPTDEIMEYMKRGKKDMIQLTGQFQNLNASSCGYWCMWFLIMMKHGKTAIEVSALLQDTKKNEIMLRRFFK